MSPIQLPTTLVGCFLGLILAVTTGAAQVPATAPEQTTQPNTPQQMPAEQTAPQQEKSQEPEEEQKATPAPEAPSTVTRAEKPSGQSSNARAWKMLKAGMNEENKDRRATAVRVLGLIKGDRQAEQLADRALLDKEPEVRAAAASALGQMRAKGSIPKLRGAVRDKESEVVFAAASSLRMLGDPEAYRVYYAVLTGKLKSGQGLIEEQKEKLKDPKKMALFGFEEGIGFIPFAGLGYKAFKALRKDDSSPVRAAAAKVLAKDPDPISAEALVEAATQDDSWVVRTAALDAIAERGDRSLLQKIVPSLSDEKEEVRFTAAAAILRLAHGNNRKKAKGHSAGRPARR